MLSAIKLLGVTLDLSPKPCSKGYYSDVDAQQLLDMIDSVWDDFPMYGCEEIADKVKDLLIEQYPDYVFKLRYHHRDDNFTMRVDEPLNIAVNTEEGTLGIPHIGVTIRTLQGAAAAADLTRRKWRIQLLPTKVVIGEIRLRPTEFSDHPEVHD